MFKLFIIFLLFSPLFANEHLPVFYEERVRPLGTLPQEEQVLSKLLLLPLKAHPSSDHAGEWLTLSADDSKVAYSAEWMRKIRSASDEKALAQTLIDAYGSIAGNVYKKTGANKKLHYPTKGQLNAELILHHIPVKWTLFSGFLLAIILLIMKKERSGKAILVITLAIHSLVIIVRCYILNRPPVSNMSETLLYAPWVAILFGLLFSKGRDVLLSATCAASVIVLFLPAKLALEPAQAVLNSHYWLIIHVLMIVGSYGVFLVAGIMGHLFLLQKNPTIEKKLFQALYIGTALLILGTILGGVWAAESWGRFWDWDPKESWAFISSGIYLAWIHAYQFKKIRGKGLAIGAITGLMAISFTWYGVNYILGTGLHSYGFGHGGMLFYFLYLGGEIFFLIFHAQIKNFLYKNWEIAKKGRKR